MKRIDCSDVTDTLMRAAEHADKMKHVVVLYETKDEEDCPGGLFTQGTMTLSQMNWLFDLGKKWLLRDSVDPKVE